MHYCLILTFLSQIAPAHGLELRANATLVENDDDSTLISNMNMNVGDYQSIVQTEAPLSSEPPSVATVAVKNTNKMKHKRKEVQQVPAKEGFEVNFLAKDDDPNQ